MSYLVIYLFIFLLSHLLLSYLLLVTAKIRLLQTTEETISFMRKLQDAGATAITGIYLIHHF